MDVYLINALFNPREYAKRFIVDFLEAGEKLTTELDEAAKAAGISKNTLNRAKTDLSKNGMLKFRNEGFGRSKTFYSRIEN